MTCQAVRAKITAYLDGELDETTASSLRGHLRTCAECRALGEDHARIVDALASIAPPEPPAAMWAGVKARLGAAEIEDSRRSWPALWWRRLRPHLVPGLGLVAAAAAAVVWIDHRRAPADEPAPAIATAPSAPVAAPRVVAPPPPAPTGGDVAEDLRGDDDRADASYRAAAEELIAMAGDARTEWTAAQARSFDSRVASLRLVVQHAAAGEARERAWQALIEYVQRAVVGVRIAEVP